jgi:hypothetical protein
MDAHSKATLMMALRVLESRNTPMTELTTAEIQLLTASAGESPEDDFTVDELACFVICRELDKEWPAPACIVGAFHHD